MNRRSITIVVVIVLCAVGFAYGQGWLRRSHPSTEIDSKKANASQAMDQKKTNDSDVPMAQPTAEPAATVTK